MTTNKNNIAIAPTYTITNTSPIKSAPKKKHIIAEFKKIKQEIELNGHYSRIKTQKEHLKAKKNLRLDVIKLA